MRYFISRARHVIRYHEFASDVWGQEVVREKTIQEAVNALKRKLREMDFGDLADRIASDSEGYIFQ